MKAIEIKVIKVGDLLKLEVDGEVVIQGKLASLTDERAGEVEVHKYNVLAEGWENV